LATAPSSVLSSALILSSVRLKGENNEASHAHFRIGRFVSGLFALRAGATKGDYER
jgi:hypothetical protein